MTIKTTRWVRKPFFVDAVQVTEENRDEVAKWCGGEVRTFAKPGRHFRYIKVQVARALSERQTMAFDGDWILKAGKGFKVYTTKAFEQSFEQMPESYNSITVTNPNQMVIGLEQV